MEKEKDPVKKPEHYLNGKYQLRYVLEDIIKSQQLPGYEAFLAGQLIKYIARYNTKNGLEDLLKAKELLDWLIKEVKERDG